MPSIRLVKGTGAGLESAATKIGGKPPHRRRGAHPTGIYERRRSRGRRYCGEKKVPVLNAQFRPTDYHPKTAFRSN